jgi:hypothetical protein
VADTEAAETAQVVEVAKIDQAAGGGGIESKQRRLRKHYTKVYGE